MYATKRRRRNVKNYKHQPKENQKSNPSKRHRERLNAELENLASLLPFEQTVLTKLDKLSILRLAVSYLRIKSYFQASLTLSNHLHQSQSADQSRNKLPQQLFYLDPNFSEGNAILESLNGFILIANSNSEVFYASRTVEQYLGFHQSDIIHQSIYELIHSEDRDEFKRQLTWNSHLPSDKSDLTLNDLLTNEAYSQYLNRNFTVRFRCLLDNTSGFVTLDIVGHLGVLYGQRYAGQPACLDNMIQNDQKPKNSKLRNHQDGSCANEINAEQPIIALFAVACLFGSTSLYDSPNRDSIFKSKHKVNLAPLSFDSRGKTILGYTDPEVSSMGAYDLIHPDDLKYYSNAHKELLKTGNAGLVCYRVQMKTEKWQWLQSSMRVIYKSNKPEYIVANHRSLTSDEGEELLYKRGVEFKLSYPCMYDFESNFGSVLKSNCPNEDALRLTSNTTASLLKPVQAKAVESSNKMELDQAASYHATSSSKKTKAKAGKVVKSSRNSSVKMSAQYAASLLPTYDYLKIEPQMKFDSVHMNLQNDYANNTDYYNGYLTTLNSYNYSNYLTADSTNKFYTNTYPNGFLYNSNQNQQNQVPDQTNWYNTTTGTSPATKQHGINSYQLLTENQTPYVQQTTLLNTTTTATATTTTTPSSYADVFQAGKYSTANGAYLENYQNATQISSSGDYSLLSIYGGHQRALLDSKPNFQSSLSSMPGFNTDASDINNNQNSSVANHSTKIMYKSSVDKDANPKTTTMKSMSSSSPSNSKSSDGSYLAVLTPDTKTQQVNNKSKYNSNSVVNNDKAHLLTSYAHDFNSLSSYSASSCSSSASSSISNYCDDNNTKFIKQDNCMVDLPIINTNNIRSGFIKDYYTDMTSYYQTDVNI